MKRIITICLLALLIASSLTSLTSCGDDGLLGELGALISGKPEEKPEDGPKSAEFEVEMTEGNVTNVLREVAYKPELISRIVTCASLEIGIVTVTPDGTVSAVAPGKTSVVIKLDNGALLTFNITVLARIIPEHTHNPHTVIGEVVSSASCTECERRYELTVCESCGEELSRTVVEMPNTATGHTDGIPTRENETADSYDLVTRCLSCGTETARETVKIDVGGEDPDEKPGEDPGDNPGDKPCEHKNTYTAIENNRPASCESGAYHDEVVYCRECGDELSRTVINTAPPSHLPGDCVKENEIEADCNNGGSYYLAVYCTECGGELSRDLVITEPKGHKEGTGTRENYVMPTCFVPGSYDIAYYCTVCGVETRRDSFTQPTSAHTRSSYTEDGERSTCTVAGWYYEVVWCPVCRNELERHRKELPLAEHTPGEVLIENEIPSTCTEKGSCEEVTYCTECGNEASRVERELDYAEHIGGGPVRENEIASTCTVKGSYESVISCTVCGEEVSRTHTVAELLPHGYGEWFGNTATCTLGGEEYRSCGSCGHVDTRATEPKGHSFDKFLCTVCGAHKESEGLLYTLSEDESYYIVSGMGDCTDTELAVPAEHRGLPVKEIGDSAFSTYGGGIKLTAVYLPEGIVAIGDHAFAYKWDMAEINLPSTLREIGAAAFYQTALSGDVVIPDGVVSVGSGAFSGTNIVSVYIPASVTYVIHAFGECLSLETITVHQSNRDYCSIDGNLYDRYGYTLYQYALGNKRTVFELPLSTNTLAERSMSGAAKLETVIFGEGFYQGIDRSGILDCFGIKEFVVHEDNPNFKSVDGHLYSKDGARLYRYAPAKDGAVFTVPDGVAEISYAFYNCDNLVEVVLPSSVSEIGEHAFGYCDKLTTVNIPSGVTSIADYAFIECPALDGIALSEGLEYIGKYAFSNTGITEITLPDSISEVGEGCFSGCERLVSVDTGDGLTLIDRYLFSACSAISQIVIGNKVTVIGEYAFDWCTALVEVVIPDNVELISTGAFYKCEKLARVALGTGLCEIGPSAFSECVSLAEINLPEGLKRIGNYAFYNCKSLESIAFVSGIEEIASSAFCFAGIVGEVVIPETVTTLGGSAFYGCKGITSVTVGSDGIGGITEIASHTFGDCPNIERLTIKNSVTYIDKGAFYRCSSLAEIIIPDSVTEIAAEAFYECKAATRIVIGNAVTKLGINAFYWNESVKELVIGSSLSEVGWMALYFAYDHVLDGIYYLGTEEEWSEISFAYGTHNIEASPVYYYSEQEPAADGAFWHYDEDGKPVVWKSAA